MRTAWVDNMGTIDRIARIAIGLMLLLTGLLTMHTFIGFPWVLVFIGAVLVITGSLGVCPLYKAFGNFDTLDENEKEIYPSWRHHSEQDRSRYNRYGRPSNSYERPGRGHQAGVTRQWVWSEKNGTELRSAGVYRAGHSKRRYYRV